jgi:hypothetical protein
MTNTYIILAIIAVAHIAFGFYITFYVLRYDLDIIKSKPKKFIWAIALIFTATFHAFFHIGTALSDKFINGINRWAHSSFDEK